MTNVSDNTATVSPEDAMKLRARWQASAGEGRTLAEQTLDELTARKKGQGPHAPMDLQGLSLAGQDLSGLDLSRCDLSHADLTGANLQGTNLSFSKLCNATLQGAKLVSAELLNADLSHATLDECDATRALMGAANLDSASLINATFNEASLSEANLHNADLRAAHMDGASLRDANLEHASFIRASLVHADLKHARVHGANFESANLRESRMPGIAGFEKAHWVGVDLRDVDFTGAYLARRHIMDDNYLYEFRHRNRWHEIVYYVWWATSDCGRSVARLTGWVVAITLLYAGLYTLVGLDYNGHWTPFAPVYYSFVTLTTLGYGDILPDSMFGQMLAVSQALLGYFGLGGLLSILANKMARRAD